MLLMKNYNQRMYITNVAPVLCKAAYLSTTGFIDERSDYIMNNMNYNYASNCRVIRKSYGEYHITITVELPEDKLNQDSKSIIIQMMSELSGDLLNDIKFNSSRKK